MSMKGMSAVNMPAFSFGLVFFLSFFFFFN